MLEFFNNLLPAVQHGIFGLLYGIIGASVFVAAFNVRKGSRFKRIVTGAIIGHITALFGFFFGQMFNPSLVLAALLGFSGGYFDLVYAQAIGDKLANKLGLNLKKAEKDIEARKKRMQKVEDYEKELERKPLPVIESEGEKRIAEIERRLSNIERTKE